MHLSQSSETCPHSKSLNGNMRWSKKTSQKVGPVLTIFTLQEPLVTTEVLSKAFLLYSRTKTSLVEFILLSFFIQMLFFLKPPFPPPNLLRFLYLLRSILRRRPPWMKEGGPSSMRRSLIANPIHPLKAIIEDINFGTLDDPKITKISLHKRKKSTLSSSGKIWRSSYGLTKTCRVLIHL